LNLTIKIILIISLTGRIFCLKKGEKSMGLLNFIKRYQVLSYYFFVFAISWGGILALIGGPGNIPGTKEQVEKLFIPALLIMFAGPFLSGILMNLLVGGKKGLHQLLLRYLQWRIKAHWYAVAVLAGPLPVAAVLFGLSLFNPAFLPGIVTTDNIIALLLFGIGWGLIGGGLLEETGWTGFAVPRLLQRHSILSTGLIVGVLWGIWHFLIAFWSSDFNYLGDTDSWIFFVAGFLAFYLLARPAYRILLVWVYDRTNNLPVIMLMHASLSASTLIFQPSATGAAYLIWNLILSIILWIVVVVVIVASRNQLSRKPIRHKI
jgi:membrane protease YdiL (CAAX protease family)